MSFLGLSIWAWCSIFAVALVVAAVWFYGKNIIGPKVTEAFYKQLFADLREILQRETGLMPQDIDAAIDMLEKGQGKPSFPESILRIEYALEWASPSKVNRILAVAYEDREGNGKLAEAKREYDWDFIPDELASESIRSTRKTINIEIYTKQQ